MRATKKQTAVGWLVQCIESMDWGEITTRKELYSKAKEMEKEQIIDAYKTFLDTTLPKEVYEQYYTETYETN